MRFLTAGESHGEAVVALIEGFPKGVLLDCRLINRELKRRMSGYGRGKRMKIEADTARFISGLRNKITLGSPIVIYIKNKDHTIFSQKKDALPRVSLPRPAHADLAGHFKYAESDVRNILERSSARSTAALVSVGAVCKQFLENFGVCFASHIIAVGEHEATVRPASASQIIKAVSSLSVPCIDATARRAMISAIDKACAAGDSLGGVAEVWVEGVIPGLGSFMHPDKRLDARIAGYLMGIPSVKGVEIGAGFRYSTLRGSCSHDEITYSKRKGFSHTGNNSGGIEGGVSTGEPIVARIAVKPVPTLRMPLSSADLLTKKAKKAPIIRSDTCVVPAAAVIAESMIAISLTECMLEKFGSDTLLEISRSFAAFKKTLRR